MTLVESISDIINSRMTIRRAIRFSPDAEPIMDIGHYDAKTGDYIWGGIRKMTPKEKILYEKNPDLVINRQQPESGAGFR